MTGGRRRLAAAAAAAALVVGCSGSDARQAEPPSATASPTGRPGSAVILGQVDSKRGPAVFFRLHQLRRGDRVTIGRADRASVRFVIQRTEQYPKDRFPTEEVYYPTLTPALGLVTCGGEFDTTIGHYRSNLIVYATMHS
jgi:Sortase domain